MMTMMVIIRVLIPILNWFENSYKVIAFVLGLKTALLQIIYTLQLPSAVLKAYLMITTSPCLSHLLFALSVAPLFARRAAKPNQKPEKG